MSRKAARLRGLGLLGGMVALAIGGLGTSGARAQGCDDLSWRAVSGEAHGPVSDASADGDAFDGRVLACADAAGTVPPSRVAIFAEVARLVMEARTHTTRLEEDEALRILATARTLAESAAEVPGAAAWLAEVETAVGITAAQSGLSDLARTAFTHAATLDPERHVKLAEASPDIVAVAEGIASRVAALPSGSFVVNATAVGASVWVDDVAVGRAPQTVRLPVGRHVLRVEAPGHRAYGSVLDVLEGERPAVTVALTDDGVRAQAAALREAAAAMDPATVVTAAAALRDETGVRASAVLAVQSAHRAAVTRCGADGCTPMMRLAKGEPVPEAMPLAEGSLSGAATAAALAGVAPWLDEMPPALRPKPVAERWDMWLAAGVLVAVSTTLVILGTSAQTPETERRFILNLPDGARP